VRVAYPSEPTQITWYGGTANGWASFVDDDPDGIGRIDVWLSTDGGVTFPTLLATQVGWTTIVSFPIPDVATTHARVKVVASDVLGNAGSDVGDNDFTIVGQTAPPPPPPPPPTTTTAPPSTDTVAVTRAEYAVSKKELRLEATGSNATATLKAYVTSSGALIGTLVANGGGKYSLQTTWPTNPVSVTVRSTLGGSATATVVAK
jgi:hypothetical protein